ncbi:MAG: glycosyltransferase family 87 protein [Acidimicrobiales bacterium]
MPVPTGDFSPRGRSGSDRANRLAKAALGAMLAAFSIAVWVGAGLDGQPVAEGAARLGGDYPAFHAAGSIILDGDLDQLYSAERQRAEQEHAGIDGYLAYAYPPHVAYAYAPLAALGFRVGYAVHTLLMVGALFGALRLLSTPVPALRQWMWPAFAATLAFYPIFKAVGGGQNTALSVLLVAAVWRLLADDRETAAGVASGLLLFRPQYALPLICLLGLARHGRAVRAAVVTALVTWAAVATVAGLGWISWWMEAVLPFVERDAEVNAPNSISIVGFLQAIWGHDATPALVLGFSGAALVAATLAWTWAHPTRFSLDQRMGLTAVGVLLISPHTMFYDAGLLVVAGGALFAAAPAALEAGVALKAAGLVWTAALLHPAAAASASPLGAVVVFVFGAWVWLIFNRSQPSSFPADRSPNPEVQHA